jgi:Predicted membrane protein
MLGHPGLYAMYGVLSAGIVEETARFLVNRTIMKDSVGRENAVTTGVGFAGLEGIMAKGSDDALYAHDVHIVQDHGNRGVRRTVIELGIPDCPGDHPGDLCDKPLSGQ